MRLSVLSASIVFALSLMISVILVPPAVGHALADDASPRPLCDDNGILCTETWEATNYEGQYTGHDEPSVLFYSNVPGSGNSNVYKLRLPKDPPVLPKQDGTGGTFNFQLHPAFWFGMAMCDTQSAPEYTSSCTPDSDTNIFDGSDPLKTDYIGHHPGTAFMEMQFYPPGWALWPAGISCDATKWCAALNIDSFSENMNNGKPNNDACLNTVGIEPVNFAFITKDGVAQSPANPLNFAHFTPDLSKDLLMNSGDKLIVTMHDTAKGFQVIIKDQTTGETGSMTASIPNGFGQVVFDPAATTCSVPPYAFHPMYSTSSEHTRVPWAAHTYNVAFADEIGHWEYCNSVDSNGNCTAAGVSEPAGVDADDDFCFAASASSLVPVSGCTDTDFDFDGVSYQKTWPGTLSNQGLDQRLNPRPIRFSSPLFSTLDGLQQNYDRLAFEADLPRIEFATNPPCRRLTGQDCVNPPVGANFYPIFTTTAPDDEGEGDGQCRWQLGGTGIPGTKNTFGGTSTTEYGPLLSSVYPASNGQPVFLYNNFRKVLSNNPCRAHEK